MRIINRVLKFYDVVIKNTREGKGSTYQIALVGNLEDLKDKLISLSTFLVKLDTKNEVFHSVMTCTKNIHSYQKPVNAITEFIGMLWAKENKSSDLLFVDRHKNLVIYSQNEKCEVPQVLLQFKKMMSPVIDIDWKVIQYDRDLFCNFVQERLRYIEDFYVSKNGSFLRTLLENFPDEISKKSLQTYLQQRLFAKVHGDYSIVYPVSPPKITENWRKERLSCTYTDLPIILEGKTDVSVVRNNANFVLEQYAVRPGVGLCEVESGDIVIDAGAFIGDTSLYFAKKCGGGGRVYAFEPMKENLEYAKQNIYENGFESRVDLVPYALSDSTKILYFSQDSSSSTGVDFNDPESVLHFELEQGRAVNESELVQVEAVSLDDFVQERNLKKIDFIKADLEGADVDFLKGSLKTIEKYAPKCGLCVYHRPEDFIVIPKLLMSACDDYVFYFRCEVEPVIFCKRNTR